MLLPNDQGPFSPTDHNILVEDKRPCILNASAPSPLHLSADHTGNTLTPSDQLVSLPESDLTKAVSVYTVQLWALDTDPSKKTLQKHKIQCLRDLGSGGGVGGALDSLRAVSRNTCRFQQGGCFLFQCQQVFSAAGRALNQLHNILSTSQILQSCSNQSSLRSVY